SATTSSGARWTRPAPGTASRPVPSTAPSARRRRGSSMPRRYKPPKRPVTPDPVYNSESVAKFINIVMHDGKRAVAEGVMYDALRRAGRQARKEPIEVFDQ